MISRSGWYPGTIFDSSSRAPGITLPPGGAASSLPLFSLHSAACLLVRRRNTVETFSVCLRLCPHLRFPHEDWLITDIQEPRLVLARRVQLDDHVAPIHVPQDMHLACCWYILGIS